MNCLLITHLKLKKLTGIFIIQNRKKYEFIDKIGKKFSDDIDWWMSLPSYRNPYASKLLNYLTVLDTIQKLKNKEII